MSNKKFQGFDEPRSNYTRIPNQFFDELLPLMESEAEKTVLLVAIRQTWGWHREEAGLSATFLAEATGMDIKTVRRGLAACLRRGTMALTMGHTYREEARYKVVMRADLAEQRGQKGTSENGQRGQKGTSQRGQKGTSDGAEDKQQVGAENTGKTLQNGPKSEGAKRDLKEKDKYIYTRSSSNPKRRSASPPKDLQPQIPLDPDERAAWTARQEVLAGLKKALMDFTKLTARQSEFKIANAAVQLADMGATAEGIERFTHWWRRDWRSGATKSGPGTKLPSPSQVVELWEVAKAEAGGRSLEEEQGRTVTLSLNGFGG